MSSRPLPKTGEENLHFFPGNSHVFQEQQETLWKPCGATEKDLSKLMSFGSKTKQRNLLRLVALGYSI